MSRQRATVKDHEVTKNSTGKEDVLGCEMLARRANSVFVSLQTSLWWGPGVFLQLLKT